MRSIYICRGPCQCQCQIHDHRDTEWRGLATPELGTCEINISENVSSIGLVMQYNNNQGRLQSISSVWKCL